MDSDQLDTLFVIADAALFLDKLEQHFRDVRQPVLADNILKLQQDVSVEIQRDIVGDIEAGPMTADLCAHYEPVTTRPARFGILHEALDRLGAKSDLRPELSALIKKLPPIPVDWTVQLKKAIKPGDGLDI